MSSAVAGSSPQEQGAGAPASTIEDEPLQRLLSSPPSSSFPPPRASLGLESPPDDDECDLITARRCLYLSHALSAWGARGWEFAAGLALFFFEVESGKSGESGGQQQQHASLSLVAAMGLAQSIAQALFGPWLGKEVDRLPRLTVAKRAYGLQASATLASALFVLAARGKALSPTSSSTSSPVASYLLGSVAALFAAAAAVGASWATLSVEREWTQALAKEPEGRNPPSPSSPSPPPPSSSAVLASINSTMRRIDLACLLASPGVSGILLSSLGTGRAVSCIALYSVAAWVPQSWLLGKAVRAAPSRLSEDEGGEGKVEREERGTGETTSSSSSPLSSYLSATHALPSALSLALLYFTVLSFGPLATAYLHWRGMREVELAFWRGCGAAAGLAATAFFPAFLRRGNSTTDAAGALGISAQLSCLVVGCLSAFASSVGSDPATATDSLARARVLAASLSLSRFGLWLFDLAASQNLQERVPTESVGAVNGVQSAMQAGLGAAAFAFGLVVPRPRDFAVLGFGSLGAVTLAAVVFFVGTAMVGRTRRT